MKLPYDKSKVTAVIPAKDEGKGLSQILAEVKWYTGEIIVIDGHSRDNTREIVRKSGALYFLDNGIGRGDAVKIGISQAKNEIVVLVDADGSHEISDIPRLVEPLFNSDASLIISSRRTGGSTDMEMNFDGLLRSAGSDFLVMLVNHKFKTNLTDILYSFRAVKKSRFKKIKILSDDFCIEQEMIVGFLKRGFEIIEIPSREKKRAWGVSKLSTIMGIKFIFRLLYDLYLRRW